MTDTFLADILKGLRRTPKILPSKYFYDANGSKLFQLIMKLPEYYLTKSEYEILDTQSEQILADFAPTNTCDIVEFGAGDGSKTKLLLKSFLESNIDFRYLPVDISQSALEGLASNFSEEFSNLDLEIMNDDYFSALKTLKNNNKTKLVLFLGSNIGNFKDNEDINFLRTMRNNLKKGDCSLIGFDLRKDPNIILAAYNDKQGVTREFNLNLLKRINRDLNANFDIPFFEHFPTYNPVTGESRSYLISMKEQTVNIADESIEFAYSEPIFMEVSKKYSEREIELLAEKTGFRVVKNYYDCRHYFLDSLWVAV